MGGGKRTGSECPHDAEVLGSQPPGCDGANSSVDMLLLRMTVAVAVTTTATAAHHLGESSSADLIRYRIGMRNCGRHIV